MYEYNSYEVGERLAIMRNRLGISQEEAASRIGISRNALSKYENGNNRISAEVILKFARLYDTSVDYLLLGKEVHLTNEIDLEILYMLEGYSQKRLKALRSILKGIQDICNGAA